MLAIRTYTLLAVLFFCLVPLFSHAQVTAGIGLTPSLIEEGADPGDILERSISVTNLSDEEQTYFIFTRDIRTVREGGVPVYADPGTERTGFELTEWLELGEIEITLAPGEEQTIPVNINVPDTASPGSHFGGIFISKEAPRFRDIGASVGYEVANIVSIRISGDAVENAQIRSFRTDKLVYGETNVTFMAEVENKGNILVRPYGPVEVYNMFGQQVSNMMINEAQGGVFPFTRREFTLTWEDDALGFGRYQAIVSMIYGDTGRQSTISSTVSFWILPMDIITPALIILAILLLTAYFAVRMYIRRTVATISGGRRVVRRRRRQSGMSTLVLVAIVMLAVTAVFLIILLLLFA